jgi:hypothetical protein
LDLAERGGLRKPGRTRLPRVRAFRPDLADRMCTVRVQLLPRLRAVHRPPASGTPPLVMLAAPGAPQMWAATAFVAGTRRTRVRLGKELTATRSADHSAGPRPIVAHSLSSHTPGLPVCTPVGAADLPRATRIASKLTSFKLTHYRKSPGLARLMEQSCTPGWARVVSPDKPPHTARYRFGLSTLPEGRPPPATDARLRPS